MYIVISKPKRISVKSGLVHMIHSSRIIVGSIKSADAGRASTPSMRNSRVKFTHMDDA